MHDFDSKWPPIHNSFTYYLYYLGKVSGFKLKLQNKSKFSGFRKFIPLHTTLVSVWAALLRGHATFLLCIFTYLISLFNVQYYLLHGGYSQYAYQDSKRLAPVVCFKLIYGQFGQSTGKSVSEALILESVNPQYDKRLFIEFPE